MELTQYTMYMMANFIKIIQNFIYDFYVNFYMTNFYVCGVIFCTDQMRNIVNLYIFFVTIPFFTVMYI